MKIPHHDYLPTHRFSVIYHGEERATLKIEREVQGAYQSELEANFINGKFASGKRFILLGLENQCRDYINVATIVSIVVGDLDIELGHFKKLFVNSNLPDTKALDDLLDYKF